MRDVGLRFHKATLRSWFAARSIDYLTRVVDECRAGTFAFGDTCRCLRGLMDGGLYKNYSRDALAAEHALCYLAIPIPVSDDQATGLERVRRVRTLPIVLAEIRKRHRVPTAPPVEVSCE